MSFGLTQTQTFREKKYFVEIKKAPQRYTTAKYLLKSSAEAGNIYNYIFNYKK